MTIISVLMILVVIGVVLWLINKFIPMDGKIKAILNAVIVILVILWLLNAFGVIGPLSNIHPGNIRIGNMRLM
jgi:1-acyl-sn-glycerol-3-phosphate acyltransferase